MHSNQKVIYTCKRCSLSFTEVKQYQQHIKYGKRCLELSSTSSLTKKYDTKIQISFEEQVYSTIKNPLICCIKQWSAKFKQPPSVKMNTLISYFISCFRKIPDLSLKFKDFGDSVQWNKYSLSPYDFAQSFEETENILKKMPKQQSKIARKQLKNLAQSYPQIKISQIKIYKPPKAWEQQKLISIDDIGKVIFTFLSGDQDSIHFGLDLYIVFATGQRVIGEYKTFDKQILNYLQSDKEFFQHAQQKKKKIITIQLPKQLLCYLKQFNWSGWSKYTLQSFRRSSKWLGVTLHKIRKAHSRVIAPAMAIASSTLNHRRVKTTKKYTGNSLNYLVCQGYFQGLKYQFGSHAFREGSAMQSHLNQDFYAKWKQLRGKKQTIHFISNEQGQPHNNSVSDSDTEQQSFEQQQEQEQGEQDAQKPEQSTDYESQPILINGQILTPSPSLFACQNHCIYCKKLYKYPCTCLTTPWISNKLALQSNTQQKTIKFPPLYTKQRFQKQLNKIRDIINLRGFSYVQQAYSAQKSLVPLKKFQIAYIPDHIAQSFIDLKYFPPIQVRKAGTNYKGNQSLGIFALEQIKENTFIGQYAADIVKQQHVHASKRQDTIMRVRQNYVIVPVGRMGYVCLINGTVQKPNCRAAQIVIHGALRVIIITKRNIKNGEQLRYVYSNSYFSKEDSQTEEQISIQQSPTPQKQVKKPQTQPQPQPQPQLQPQLQPQPVLQPQPDLQSQPQIQSQTQTQPFLQPQNQENINLIEMKRLVIKQSKIQEINNSMRPQKKQKKEKIVKIQKSANISPEINNCFAFAILFIFRYFKEQITSHNYFSRKLFDKQCQTSFFTGMFSKQSYIQHDFQQFFGFVNRQLFRNSPFPLLITKQTVQCQQQDCLSTMTKFASEHAIFLNTSSTSITVTSSSVKDYVCRQCLRKTQKKQQTSIISHPKRIFFCIKRFKNNLEKNTNQFNYQNEVQINKQAYKLIFLVFHDGASINSGHYYLRVLEYERNVNSNKIGISKNQIVGLVYEVKEFNFQSISVLSQKNIVLNVRRTQNFQIASIAKVLAVIQLKKIFESKNISLQKKIQTKSLQIDASSHIKLNKKQIIANLINNSLIVSCCNSLYSLVQFAKSQLNQTETKDFQALIQEYLKSNDINNTFISDCIGLQANVSTIEDLNCIINLIKKDDFLVKILSKPSISNGNEIYQSSNMMIHQYIGKTGFTKNKMKNFIGWHKKTYQNVIMLYYDEKQLWKKLR